VKVSQAQTLAHFRGLTVAQLASWTVAALQAPDVRAKLVAVGLFPVGLCRADFTAYLRKQYDEYADARYE
jgi:hypothetical protein